VKKGEYFRMLNNSSSEPRRKKQEEPAPETLKRRCTGKKSEAAKKSLRG